MDITLKQRLVGVMVLISLGIIFLPSLFYRETDNRTVVDTQSLIPPKPAVRTIVINPPQDTAPLTPAVAPSEAFLPSQPAQSSSQNVSVPSAVSAKAQDKKVSESIPSNASQISSDQKSVAEPTLRLDNSGLPESWVIQAASFQSKEHAEAFMNKLRSKDLKAYIRSATTSKGSFFRVLIGPYLSQPQAESDKAVIDKEYKVVGQILRFSSK